MYHKYPDVDRLTRWLVDNKNYLDGEIEITEKLDGSNFSFQRSSVSLDSMPIWRSRSGIIKPENLNNFRTAIDFVTPMVVKLKDNEVIFGENVAQHHRVHYIDDRFPFYAFGVYDMDAEKFTQNWRRRCKRIGIPVVDTIDYEIGSLEELLDLRCGSSMIGPEREGIVIKNYDTQTICKLVDPKYEESHVQKEPRTAVQISNDVIEFVNTHCTENRVLKAIFRLHDEDGEAFDMPMMRVLPKAVANDIFKECDVPEDINIKQMNKLIADMSRETLKKYLNGEVE